MSAAAALAAHARLCATLQALVAVDAGGRGVAALLVPGDLARASLTLLAAPSVLILSGFPCRLTSLQPAETDGPSGAVAVAGAALSLGKRVALATDDCCARALAAALASRSAALAAACAVHAFPPAADAGWALPGGGALAQRRAALARAHAHTVAVERAGAAADGRCYTMRGLPMPAAAPLDCLMAGPGVTSTGIGDGGNEAGMGRVAEAVRQHIPLGQRIACVTDCDSLVAAGVSNWGAWALVGAVEAAARLGLPVACAGSSGSGSDGSARALPAADAARLRLLPTRQQEEALAEALAAEGVGDGVSGQVLPPGSVDGLPASVHHAKLQELREAVDAAVRAAALA
jgi:hypothetical protein